MGAGAQMYGGVYLSTPPDEPFTVTFTPTGVDCMIDTGSAQSVQVTDSGVTSVSLGYVESKNSGWHCYFGTGAWQLALTSTDQPQYNETASTSWEDGTASNTLSLKNPDATKICLEADAAKGTDTTQTWNGVGSFYVIFILD